MNRRGFTLPELLIFTAVFAGIVVGLGAMLVTLTGVQSRQSSANEVETQGQFLTQQIQYYVQSARLVDMPQDAPVGAMTTSTYGTGAYSSAIAFDGTNMWTVSSGGGTVTKISPAGATTTYEIGAGPSAIAFDGTNMWTANYSYGTVTKISPTGATTTYTGISNPKVIAYDGVGNMWTADWNNDSVTKINVSTGATTTYPGIGHNIQGIAFDGAGNIWTANHGNANVTKINVSTGATTTYYIAFGPHGIAFDGTNMWTANGGGCSVTKISPTGTMATYGTGVCPNGIAFDGTNMWTANADNTVTKVSPTGTVTTYYTGTGDTNLAIAFDGTNMWTANGGGNGAAKISLTAGTLVLRESNTAQDPTSISVSSGTVNLQQGTGWAPQALTSNKVVVRDLLFTRHYAVAGSSAYGTDSVSYSFTMAANTANATQQYSQTFRGSVAVRVPVPQIARLQQAKAENANTGITSISAAYPTANTAGNLLVAIVSNTGTSSAMFGISDTAGNTWAKVANPKYAAYNQETTVFYAPNAKSGANTVTASSTVAVTNPSLFIYEYRGANAVSPSPAGTTTTYAGTAGGYNIAFDGTNMWTANDDYPGSVTKISPTGATTTYTGMGLYPMDIAFDGTNMWTTDSMNGSVTKISPAGAMTTYTGLGSNNPGGIAFDGTNMWTANGSGGSGSSVTRVSPSGAMTTYLTGGAGPGRIAFDGINMWTSNYSDNSVTKISPSGTMTTYTGTGDGPLAIAFDGTNMWTANGNGDSVTKISPSGAMTTYTGAGNPVDIDFDGINMWTANGGSVTKISPAGAMTIYPGIGVPIAIAFDGTNMWTCGYRVTKVATGLVTTHSVAAQLQVNAASPSSGFTMPTTPGVELAIGILYSNPSGVEIPNPGSGFTVLTTSTVSATYVEDKNIYVTGPLAATWQYPTQSPNSSAVMVTFSRAQ